MTINLNEINTLPGTQHRLFTFGKLFIEHHGLVLFQCFHGKREGVVCYGVKGNKNFDEELFIDLSDFIWLDFNAYLGKNSDGKLDLLSYAVPDNGRR